MREYVLPYEFYEDVIPLNYRSRGPKRGYRLVTSYGGSPFVGSQGIPVYPGLEVKDRTGLFFIPFGPESDLWEDTLETLMAMHLSPRDVRGTSSQLWEIRAYDWAYTIDDKSEAKAHRIRYVRPAQELLRSEAMLSLLDDITYPVQEVLADSVDPEEAISLLRWLTNSKVWHDYENADDILALKHLRTEEGRIAKRRIADRIRSAIRRAKPLSQGRFVANRDFDSYYGDQS